MVGSGPGASRGLAHPARMGMINRGMAKSGITGKTRAARRGCWSFTGLLGSHRGRWSFTGLLGARLGRRGKLLELVAVLLNHWIGQQFLAKLFY